MKSYLLSVTAASILCASIKRIFDKKNGVCSIIRFVSGIMLSVVVISPILKININELDLDSILGVNADLFPVAEGEAEGVSAQKEIIQQTTAAYIQNKAAEFDCALDVEVMLQEEHPYAPRAVVLNGAVSPYAKTEICNWIEVNLSIPSEEQKWIG